jgi:hypothetical protein
VRNLVAAVGAAALCCAALSGCNVSVNTGTKAIDKADLQKAITEKFAGTEKPQSVTCPDDLEGAVGKTAKCDVVIGDANTFQVVLTVDKIDGSTANYTMAPAMSQAQVEKAVVNTIGAGGPMPQSATCDSGLEGKEGATVRCQIVDSNGQPLGSTVTIKSVDGLMMNLGIHTD